MASKTPSGGKKGGKAFPRISLADAADYARKLVSKTFTGPQPRTTLFKGVFDNSGTGGELRAAALRQYGLLDGTNEAMKGSDLAKRLTAAPPESKTPLLQRACLNPKVFKTLYDTFNGDAVSAAKVRQQAIQIGVHPDNADNCSELFLQSLQTAGLGRPNGDQFDIVGLEESIPTEDVEREAVFEKPESVGVTAPVEQPPSSEDNKKGAAAPSEQAPPGPSARSVIHINITLDSSLDTDKLQRQLELLRKFGAL